MSLTSIIKPLVPSRLRRLRWQIDQTRRYAAWLAEGGEPEALLLPTLCDPRRVSIDVGANLGGYTWLLHRFSRRVIAFEPNPVLAARLATISRLTLRWSVSVRNVALSTQSGTTALRVPLDEYGRGTIEVANRLDGRPARTVEVHTRALDDYPGLDIGFMKIDVEGHELAVLQGAARYLRTSRPNLLIEATNEHRQDAVASIVSLLDAYGYSGSFLHEGAWLDVRIFDPARHTAVDFVFHPRA